MVSEDLHILDIAENDAWVERSADVMQARIEQAIRLRGRCLMALSGGSTPDPVFIELASRDISWAEVTLLQVDERVVPVGSPQRNLTAQQAAFLSTDVSWVPLPTDAVLAAINGSAEHEHNVQAESLLAAPDDRQETLTELRRSTDVVPESQTVREVLAQFDSSLIELCGAPPILDIVHLGLGTDGHTASLVPGDKAVNELLLYSALTEEYQGNQRITLTRPIMDRARMVLWLVRGSGKRDVLGRLLRGDMTMPAGLLRPAHSVIIADSDAACQSG